MVSHFEKQNKFQNIYPIILSIILTQIIQMRPYFSKNFYGDPFDGRLQIVLHEHWYRFFTGLTNLRETNFYFPYEFGLGLSDPFLLQGTIHSIFRFINFDMYTSWALTNCVMLLIGNLGFGLLAHYSFKANYSKFFFVMISGLSFTFIAHVYVHPNITGFALIPFIFFFAINQNIKIINRISLIYVLLSLLLLTSWYGFVFTALFGILHLLINLNYLKRYIFFQLFKSRTFLLANFAALPLIFMFLYIHYPVLGEVIRTKDEMLLNSPSLNNLLNGSHLGGGIFGTLYEYFNLTTSTFFKEFEIGLTFLSFIISLISLLVLIFLHRDSQLIKIWVSNFLILVFFIKINNFSLFSFVWDFFPIATSIRIPIRYLILFSGINIYIIIKILDKLNLSGKNKRKKFYVFIFLSLFLLDQLRFTTADFEKNDYNADKIIIKTLLSSNECKAFYLDTEGFEWWNDQLEAMVIASETNIPTINGYSGGFPNNYPSQEWRSRSDLGRIGQWLVSNNAIENTCVLRRNIVTPISQTFVTNIVNGFDLTEINKSNTWNWSLSNISIFKIYNFNSSKMDKELEFKIVIPSCMENKAIKIYINDEEVQNITLNNLKKSFLFKKLITIQQMGEMEIKFITSNNYCKVQNDPRDLNFSVQNIKFY